MKFPDLRPYLSFNGTRCKLENCVSKFKARAIKTQVETKVWQFYYQLQFHQFFLAENLVGNGGTHAVQKRAGLRTQVGISFSSCSLHF